MGLKERFYADIMAVHPGVTGSCNMVIVKYPDNTTTRFIVDCGLFQEREYSELNNVFPFNEENIEFCLITHNHVDHLGRLPLLVKNGFTGKIYSTEATSVFAPLALYDSYKVLKDVAKRNHTPELFSEANVDETIRRFKSCKFREVVVPDPRIKVTFFENGHLIGAAMILVQISYPGYDDINLFFTGDYHNRNMFFDVLPLPEWVLDLPLTIVQESTYGAMDSTDMHKCFEENILECVNNKGTAVCMVFSLGRSQEILYILKRLQDNGDLDSEIPIYFDGKLAHRYTRLYLEYDLGIKSCMKDFLPENLIYVDKTSRKTVVEGHEQKIIVTTSGMGTYGPAQVYIPEYITRQNCLLHFTGYTAEGTLGRKLKNTEVGEMVEINSIIRKKRARVEYTNEFSAHAKADEMIAFLKQFRQPKLILVNHGETNTKVTFSERIAEEVDSKYVAILNRDYFFRVNHYGLVKPLSTKFD